MFIEFPIATYVGDDEDFIGAYNRMIERAQPVYVCVYDISSYAEVSPRRVRSHSFTKIIMKGQGGVIYVNEAIADVTTMIQGALLRDQ